MPRLLRRTRGLSPLDGREWTVTLRTQRVGRFESSYDLESASIAVDGNRIELDHGPVREWFENREMGVEQSWLIATGPDGNGALSIELEINGLASCLDETGRSAVLTDAAGTVRLLYLDLRVFDACGREIEASLRPSADGLLLRIEDAGATYPLTVDPMLGGADWTAESNQVGAQLGASLSGAGDVNADGLHDMIVGAYGFDKGEDRGGRASVYFGGGLIGTTYCTANTNSIGSPADLSASGSASSGAGKLTLTSSPVPNQNGIFFHGMNQSQNPFGNGFMCTTGGIARGAVTQAAGNVATYIYDNSDAKHGLVGFVNTTRNFQYWFRDSMGGRALFNKSNAISIAVLP